MKAHRLQSAMEYLMTYGWAILIIAVVLGALYQLGVFGTAQITLQSSCFASSGFLCSSPTLNSSGYLGFKFGQIGTSYLNVTAIACTTNLTAPSSTQTISALLTSGATTSLAVQCPLSSNAIGTGFKGYLWLIYSTPLQSGIVNRVAVVSAKVSTLGSVISALGGTGSVGTNILGYIYCMPNSGSTPYSAPLTSNGIGAWSTSSNSYPYTLFSTACVSYNNYIYCVGANSGSNQEEYYSSVSGGNVNAWTYTGTFPVAVSGVPCTASGGYIYCAGGIYTSNFYSAPISSSGIGSWTATNGFGNGAFGGTCAITGGYIYCLGGTNGPDQQVLSAPLLGNGAVGSWTTLSNYPQELSYNGCSIYNGYIYCTGTKYSPFSLTYFATIGSGTVGSWTSTTSPGAAQKVSCIAKAGYLYCVGATSQYATLSSSGIGTWTSTTAPPTSMTGGQCIIPGTGGGYFGGGGPD